MNDETSLVIAVCVLGTLVGVVVVVLAALLLVHCCPNGRLRPRSWVARRNRRTRAEMELEQIAAANDNFISESMLPGNRTGASENLGIRSPDPRRVPALRVPQDLSPSPPFVPGQGQNFRQTQPRSRQPSPKRGHFLTVLNTIMPQGSPPQPGHMDSHDQIELTDTNFSSKGYIRRTSDRGVYARIPSTSPKSRVNYSVRPKIAKAQCNIKGMNGYPNSDHSSEEDDDVEKCKGFGHSYYKPGGYTSYLPQNVFREKPSRKNRSPRHSSGTLYSRLPVNDNSMDSPNRSNKAVGSKSRRKTPKLNRSSKTLGNEGIHGREASRYLSRSHEDQLTSIDSTSHQACARAQDRRDRSPPLASSSRNTSQDRSTSLSVRQENSHEERNPGGMCNSNEVAEGCDGVLPRRSRRVTSRQRDAHAGRDTSRLTTSNGHSQNQDIRKPPRESCQRTRQNPSVHGCRDRLPPETGRGGRPATPADYLQTTDGQLVPVSSVMRPGPSIELVARDGSVCDGVSFRENSATSTDARPTYVHANRDAPVMGTMTGHASSTGMTLPSLTAAQIVSNINNIEHSVLYHNSQHSSTQSLRPGSHLLGGSSSTFAGSQSIHINMMQTPVAHSSHVVTLSDVEPHSPKETIRFRQQGCPKQTWRRRGAHGTDRMTQKNGIKEVVSSDTEDDRQDDRQAPDSVPPSPPASNTSSSSSPVTAISLAIQQCVPVAKEVVTMRAPPVERPSFLDSRDLVDPTTASMSWDHLTPDPSPEFGVDADLSVSQYAQLYRRKKQILAETGQADITLPGATTLDGLDFDDTFARNYELKPYKKLKIRENTRVVANLNPAIEQEVAASETICETNEKGMTKNAQTDGGSLHSIHSEAATACTSLGETQGRQNVVAKPTNILDRFNLKENASRDSVTSVKSDESFSTPLLPSNNTSVASGSCPKVPVHYPEHQKKKIFPRSSEDSTPGDQVNYSKLIQSLSLQSNAKR